ncbi:hypothetical protein FOZ62_021754, partial [Perkinsus olseni]
MNNYNGGSGVLHRFLLAAYIVSRVTNGVGEDARNVCVPLSVTADYPKGCNGGPGPAKQPYLFAGRSLHESTGNIIKSDMPGRNGDLKLQFNTMAGGPEGTSIKMVSVNISGSANLETNEDGVYVWWNP